MIKNEKHLLEDIESVERGKKPCCGRWGVQNLTTGEIERFWCKGRNCVICSGHWRKGVRDKVMELFEPDEEDIGEKTQFPERLITLTFNPEYCDSIRTNYETRIAYAKRVYNKFTINMKRMGYNFEYFWVMEFHAEESKNKYPHFHLVANCVPKICDLKKAWCQAGGGLKWECGYECEIVSSPIYDKEFAAGYITKYLLKSPTQYSGDKKPTLEKVPKNCKVYGMSRGWNQHKKRLTKVDSDYRIIREYLFPSIYTDEEINYNGIEQLEQACSITSKKGNVGRNEEGTENIQGKESPNSGASKAYKGIAEKT